jgi:hypothetical protein
LKHIDYGQFWVRLGIDEDLHSSDNSAEFLVWVTESRQAIAVSRKIYLPIIALVVGFANACIAFQVHSMLFCLLPLWAFIFGYLSSWKTGLLSSFLLFVSYTTATEFMRQPIAFFDPAVYALNFVRGGFILCIIGWGAPSVRKEVKNFKSIGVLVIMALLLVWCGFVSFPRYSYVYWVTFDSSKNLDDLEIYMPLATVDQEPYAEIFNHPSLVEGSLSDVIEDTDYGKMLKVGVIGFEERGPEPYHYLGSMSFGMSHAPHENLQFMPKYNIQEVKVMYSERFFGPMRVRAEELLQEFQVPIKVSSDTDAEIKILLGCHAGRVAGISFANYKREYYSETVDLGITTGDEWILVAGEAVRSLDVWAD